MSLRVLILFFLIAGTGEATSGAQSRNLRTGSYLFCNVYLSSACFGIAQGDKLTMEVVADYVLYRVDFAFGRSATIYSGHNPAVQASPTTKFEKCRGLRGFAECRERNLDDGGVEFLARSNARAPFLHLVLSAGNGRTAEVDSFLQNIRACRRKGDIIDCDP